MTDSPSLNERSDRRFWIFNATLSSLAVALIAFILFREGGESGERDLRFMPALNAGMNAASASCLVLGYLAIRKKRVPLHRLCMVSAFVFSTLFLLGYLAYHAVHGDTRFVGVGPIRILYFSVLITHVTLSLTVVPLALASFYFAFTRAFARHRRLNRVFLPIWLYVSVSGVAIFYLLRVTGAP